MQTSEQNNYTTKCSPAGTGTVTILLCNVSPLPAQALHLTFIILRWPKHLRHVDRITNGPVLIVSYREAEIREYKVCAYMYLLLNSANYDKSHYRTVIHRAKSKLQLHVYHACPSTLIARLWWVARLGFTAFTAAAFVDNLDIYSLVDTTSRFLKRQGYLILKRQRFQHSTCKIWMAGKLT